MWAFGIAIVSGAQLNTNLQLEKVNLKTIKIVFLCVSL